MSNVAFLGRGAMGSRMAPHLIEAGHDDLRYAAAEAATRAAKIPMLAAARGVFDDLYSKGLGGENISAAIKAYRG